MKTLMLSVAALALTSPAVGQMAEPTNPPAAEPQPTPAPEPATPAAAAEAAATPTDPATILKTEFPAYDKDKSGELSQTEFSAWMNALKAASPQKTTMTPEQETAWLNDSFTKADKDKTKSVTLAELTTYLSPPQS